MTHFILAMMIDNNLPPLEKARMRRMMLAPP